MQHDTAGDPVTGIRWTHKTPAGIAELLRQLDIEISANTVARLLHDMDFSLRVNRKAIATDSSPDRDQQFRYISSLRTRFERQGLPLISVDTKKRELVGNFKNNGVKWDRTPVRVNDHDFRSDAIGIAIPYGIYDLLANRGLVFVGVSHDTAAFAAHSIAGWWKRDGADRYHRRRQLLILADTGGSNSCHTGAWKTELQSQLCNSFGLTVTVAHYPSGASKWNPIEHRLFSEISKNWAAEPLDSYPKSSTSSAHLHPNRSHCLGLPRPSALSNRHFTRSRASSPSFPQTTFDPARLERYDCSDVNLLLRQPLAVLIGRLGDSSSLRHGERKARRRRGIDGLAEACLLVGAKSVVGTLWDVEDSATESLMKAFYSHLAQGQDKAFALRQAKLDYLQRSANSSPVYWAPFTLIGDGSAPIIF